MRKLLVTLRGPFPCFPRLLPLAALAMLAGAPTRAADAPEAPPEVMPRLLATLGSEPLAVLCIADARTLPERLAQTHVLKMFQDPTYAKGAQTLTALINDAFGAEVKVLWPDFSRQLSGPAVLAVIQADEEEGGGFRVVLAVLTANAESAAQLKALWPKAAPQAGKVVSIVSLQPVREEKLPAAAGVPKWADTSGWPKGDVVLRVQPRKLGAKLTEFVESIPQRERAGFEAWQGPLLDLEESDIDGLTLGLSLNGEDFLEELQIQAARDPDSTLGRVLETLRQDPGNWDAIAAALPGEQDITLLAQTDIKALGKDLPFAAQALERYLRGKKWSRGKGQTPESLDADRFKFLFERLQGTFGLAGRPALSGELRLAAAMAVKENDTETLRADLMHGLGALGADFETLKDARKIGAAAPLGATFQGRGLFGAPVIGLSPGWAWLCSSSTAYQDLTTAFKTGKTVAAELARERVSKVAVRKNFWRAGDAVRLQVDLEKLTKVAYTAWLFAGNEGPALGPWKVPSDLLPQPQIFNGRLGTLRAGMSRRERTLNVYAQCALPGSALFFASALRAAAEQIQNTRNNALQVLARDKEDAAPMPENKPGQERAANPPTDPSATGARP